MINETSQSEALGCWLDGNEPGNEPPRDVDLDVLEAVYALRPELAPAPKTSIEEILGHLAQADATARLLDGDLDDDVDLDVREGLFALRPDLAPAPKTSIDEILSHVEQADAARRVAQGEQVPVDDDVRDAIYALRPASAPAPKVSIEDILAKVTSGPLAAPTGEVIAFPARGAPQKAVTPANRPARSWTRVLAGSGAIGLFAVAAAAALLVLPNLSMLEGPGMTPEGARSMPTLDAPLPPAAKSPVMPEALEGAVAVDGSATDATKAQEVLQLAPPRPAERSRSTIAEVAAATPAAEPPPALAPAKEAVDPSFDDAVVDGFESEDAKKGDAEQYWSAPADAPAGGLFGGELVTETGTTGLGASREADKDAREKPRAMRGGAASNMADPSPPPPVVAAAPAAPAPKAEAKSTSTSTRDSSVATLEADAKRLARDGRYGEAARMLLPAIVEPRETGQYYAALAAEWFLDANDVPAARDAVARGLALGGPVSSELSRADSAVSRAERPAATAPATTEQQ